MTDNDLRTRPVPHQARTAPTDEPGATSPPASYQVVEGAPPAPGVRVRPSMTDRIRTPVVAAVGGGILVLGAGFGAGFAVGHGTAGGRSAVQVGPGGPGSQGGPSGQGGPGGQLGPGGQGPGGQGPGGQGQTGTDGTTDGSATGSTDSAITT